MNNVNDNINLDRRCTGCSVCSAICPTGAISIKINDNGFYRPYIDKKKCIECGKCKKICYKFENVEINNRHIKTYSAYSKNEEILMTSASGGIATHIAKYCIENDYYVVGVIYNKNNNLAEAKICRNLDDIEEIKGSKYIQAYTQKIYKEIIQDTSSRKYAIFGTPCQIYSLNKYFTSVNKRNKVLLISLFCHGTPSLKIWEKYIDLKKKENNIEKIEKLNFRSKSISWHDYCIEIKTPNKKYIYKETNDIFYNLFFSDIMLNDSCSDCTLRSNLQYCDIMLGDYWGSKYDNNDKGVSVVTICSNDGQELFEKIKDELVIESADFEDVIKNQSFGKIYKVNNNLRNNMFYLLNTGDIKKLNKYYNSKLPINKKIKIAIKKFIGMLPFNLKKKIRNMYHKMR